MQKGTDKSFSITEKCKDVISSTTAQFEQKEITANKSLSSHPEIQMDVTRGKNECSAPQEIGKV